MNQPIISTPLKVEKWGRFEAVFRGPITHNPFVDVDLKAIFTQGNKTIRCRGFYDGEGIYRLRFMPQSEGVWHFKTISNEDQLHNLTGEFQCIAPSASNHGMVQVCGQYHFAYQDGSPYYPFGTTSYGWVHQRKELAEKTLASLKNSPFNKIRMCVLPHHSAFSAGTIECFPYEGTPERNWDFTRFIPVYFQMVEKRVEKLLKMGIEADIILFHPYTGPWKLGSMPHAVDIAYLKYTVSRLSAYRNVWWSMANEYDFIHEKTMDDWDNLSQIVYHSDPYRHLLSNHNGTLLYGNWKPWITHACIQDGLAVSEPGRAVVLRNAYQKPVIYDEVCYEGNFDVRWGDLSAEELTYRYWQGIVSGTYVGHGEVLQPEGETGDMVWTGIGGSLYGKSIERIGFLRKIVEEMPGCGWEPTDKWWRINIAKKMDKTFLFYFGKNALTEWSFEIPCKDVVLQDGTQYRAEIIDTWEMTVYPLKDQFEIYKKDIYLYIDKSNKKVKLPGKPYMALRLIQVEE